MKITFFPRTTGACDWYRVVQPLRWVAKNMPEHQVFELAGHEFRAAVDADDNKKLMKVLDSDIIVMPRLWGRAPFDIIRQIVPKAKIVLEYDDNIFNISPFSPHYEDHGVEEVKVELPGGGVKDLWKDGVNINLKHNRRMYEETIQAIEAADLITTTTPILASAFQEWNKNVAVLPNCVDKDVWQKLPLRRASADVRMGWFGGSSHYEDWTLLENCLPAVMAKYPNLRLVIMGQRFQGTLKNLPQDRIEFHKWVETPAYPYKSAILNLDFGIIPLRNTPFNTCKSPIKWAELAALKVPVVGSYVSPYKEISTETNGVWVENNDPKGWEVGIDYMMESEVRRAVMGDLAYKQVIDDFEISTKYHLWPKAYEGVLNGKPNAPHLIAVS